MRTVRWVGCLSAACGILIGTAAAQQLLDRILARVGGHEITQTDVQAARGSRCGAASITAYDPWSIDCRRPVKL